MEVYKDVYRPGEEVVESLGEVLEEELRRNGLEAREIKHGHDVFYAVTIQGREPTLFYSGKKIWVAPVCAIYNGTQGMEGIELRVGPEISELNYEQKVAALMGAAFWGYQFGHEKRSEGVKAKFNTTIVGVETLDMGQVFEILADCVSMNSLHDRVWGLQIMMGGDHY